jgi:hypothetical protein
VAKESRDPITGTFVTSLNETFDTDAECLAAMRANIPGGVWLLLILVAGSGCFMGGYNAGTHGTTSRLASVFLPLLYATVIFLTFDLSYPQQGLIGISHQPLQELQESMQQAGS